MLVAAQRWSETGTARVAVASLALFGVSAALHPPRLILLELHVAVLLALDYLSFPLARTMRLAREAREEAVPPANNSNASWA
jgi:hypothetical protein